MDFAEALWAQNVLEYSELKRKKWRKLIIFTGSLFELIGTKKRTNAEFPPIFSSYFVVLVFLSCLNEQEYYW